MDVPAETTIPDVADELHGAITAKLLYSIGKTPNRASQRDWYAATALAVRDRVVDVWTTTAAGVRARGAKRVHYLSLEFLIGRLLFDAAGNLGLIDGLRTALAREGIDLDHLRTLEPDAALGNGGLGRLAACFMESMATLGIPSFGYGIRYDHGLFRQTIDHGWQREQPEDWLTAGNPWEFQRPNCPTASASAAASPPRPRAGATPSPGTRRKPCSPSRSTPPSWATAAPTPTRCGCGPPAPRTRCCSTRSTAGTMSGAHRPGARRGGQPRAVSGRRQPGRPGAAAAAGVLLRLRQPAGHAAA